jgi:hypothetical protein
MAELISTPRLSLNVQFELNHAEAAALDAIAGYGVEEFVKVFYGHLGKAYLQPHEHGLRSLFNSVRKQLPPIVERYENARAVLAGTKKVQL